MAEKPRIEIIVAFVFQPLPDAFYEIRGQKSGDSIPIYNRKISKLSPDFYFRLSIFSAVLISINEAP